MRQLKLSNPSKLNSESFALPVDDEVCKGRIDQITNELLEKCKFCYADNRGFYSMPGTKRVREDNLAIIKENVETFIFFMVGKLNRKRNKEFRWFDSGDIFSIEFIKALIEVCNNTKQTTHWIPTTSWNYNESDKIEFLALLQVLQSLPNVRLRASNPGANQVLNKEVYPLQSVVVDKLGKSTKELFYCPASLQAGKCGTCKACYKSTLKTIAYLKH
tara:strand:- start:745 stop:1395 length:651 start_codon:yes stop_codon:yes gene_type:complete